MQKSKKKKVLPASRAAKTRKQNNKNKEITIIGIIAISVFLFACIYTNGTTGTFGKNVADFVRGIFGLGAYLVPFAIVAIMIHFYSSKSLDKIKIYIPIFVAVTAVLAIIHVSVVPVDETIDTIYRYSADKVDPKWGKIHGFSGGLLGALAAEPLVKYIGTVCTYVALAGILISMFVIMFNISVSAVGMAVWGAIQKLFAMRKSKRDDDDEDDYADDDDFEEEIEEKKSKKDKKKKRKEEYDEDDAIPMPVPPEEKEYWTPEEIDAMYEEPEINIYNDPSDDGEEEISEDEKQSLHDEICNEIADVDELMVYNYPTLDLLEAPEVAANAGSRSEELKENAAKLVEALRSFHVEAQVVEISCGPTVTRYEIKPAAGVKVSQITNLSKDIALKLAAKGGVMIAPVPGKSTIGIEIANANPSKVTLREVLDSDAFKNHKSKLAVALGKDISGAPVIMDLAKMPHLLIAGATGAGKSVCINTLIVSLMYKADPNEVKLVMIDPKQVELGVYNGIPHLLIPVVKDAKKATGALSWAVQEMTERYSTFEKHNVRNIQGYNELMEAEGTPENKMASIVIIIDEFADLMMVAPGDVENYVCRIAQLARAAGMHLVIATQRPVVKFITGNIKANVPSRISFMVASAKDSMTILDMGGAEKLVGKGDMLYMPVGETKPARMQCAFVSDDDVKKVVSAVTQNCEAVYDATVIEQLEKDDEYKPDGDDPGDADELLPEAIEMAVDSGQISTSLLQRRFRIGYNRAGSIIDQMEARGIISGLDGNRPRQVLITRDQYNEMLMK